MAARSRGGPSPIRFGPLVAGAFQPAGRKFTESCPRAAAPGFNGGLSPGW